MRQTTLLDLVDSESDDARDNVKSISSNMPAAKGTGGRAAANRVAKTESKATTRRAGAKKAAAIEKELERAAQTEKPDNKPTKSTKGRKAKKSDEHEEELEDTEDILATPPGSDEPVRKKGGRGRPKKEAVVPDSSRKSDEPATKRGGRKKGDTSATVKDEPSEIPETQVDNMMDVDEADEEEDQVEDLPTFSRYSAPPSVQRNGYYQAPASASKRPATSSSYDNDPSVRRRLSEMTRKYEALERQYKDLKNVGVTEAEKTFDRLKKTSEEKTQVSSQLIASLKSEVAAQGQLVKEGEKTKRQLEASEAKIESLQAQITQMTTSLSDAKTQIKALTTKLNAARTAEATATAQAQAATSRVPGSAMKPSVMAARGLDNAQVQAAQSVKMKENLYGDLTGLLVTGVKRDGPEDVYDCIQTGRNGTLHFKLAIANENSDEDLDEAEFMYKPQLDEHRDSTLIEMLPDFLVEEITFPRPHAAKFYARVLKSLTEKLD